MTPALYLAQRLSAVVLAFAVAIHLATIIYAVHAGLSASAILGRTQGNVSFLLFYLLFVIAASVHAPIGLRSIMREWTSWRGRSLDWAAACTGVGLMLLGVRAALAVYLV